MSDSETSSSDIRVKYQNSNGENLIEDKSNDKKPQSTDTDYYFNMIANPSKTKPAKPKSESESSELNELLKNTDSEKSSSKSESSTSSSRRTSESSSSSKSSSSRKSSDSKPKYEQINVSPKTKLNDSPIPVLNQQPLFKPPVNQSSFSNVQQPVSNEIKPVEPPRPLTQQEIRMKKIEMLRKLAEIKSKGYQLSKDYDFNSSLEEMEYEYELLKSFADKRNGVKIFKGGLLQAVSVIEFLNDKYDPFDFHLTGWGEHLQVEVDNWEDVLEEIYEKYKGSGKKMAPEIKLLYLIIASASAFHFTKSQASKLPGLDSVLASNPGLLSKVMQGNKPESSQFMTPQEINIEKQREEFRKREMESKKQMQQQQMQQQMQQQSYIQQLQEQLRKQQETISNQQQMISQQIPEGFANSRIEPMPANSKPIPLPPTIPVEQLRPNIRAPDQVKDILSRIHSMPSSTIKPSATETQDETSSNNDRLVSETTLSESNPKKRVQKKAPKKSNISIF
jgi:hypothetical protein